MAELVRALVLLPLPTAQSDDAVVGDQQGKYTIYFQPK